MFDFPPYDRLHPGQLWFAPDSIGGLLRIGMTDDARAILEVAAAERGLDLPALLEADFHRLLRQWLASYRFGTSPAGTWRGRFDSRRPGRKRGFLHCLFTDLDTGERHALTVFANNRHRPRHAGPDFDREALIGQVFRLTTQHTTRGFTAFIHAEPDTRQSAGSWAIAPAAPAARPNCPASPPETAILAAFSAAAPGNRPSRP